MSIWKKKHTVEQLNKHSANTLGEHIGIEITEIGEDFLSGTMPVDHRTKQPYGILHGGASVVLAETLGSIAGNIASDDDSVCVGLEINANHLKKVSKGIVEGKATAIHIGRSTHVWDIQIKNENNDLVCVSRLTLAVVKTASLS